MLFEAANIVFGLAFSLEYLARIWAAGEVEKYRGLVGRLRYAVTPYALVDLIAVMPFFLTLGDHSAYMLRLLRRLRIFALAKLGRMSNALRNVFVGLYARRYELLVSLFGALMMMLLAGTVLYLTEREHNPESFGGIPRALWWGAATVAKLGYAGAYPVTALGKVFAAVFAIAAVGVVAVPVGIMAASFGQAFQDEAEEEDYRSTGSHGS